eukprot:UN12162
MNKSNAVNNVNIYGQFVAVKCWQPARSRFIMKTISYFRRFRPADCLNWIK